MYRDKYTKIFLFARRGRQVRSETRLLFFIARLDQFLPLSRPRLRATISEWSLGAGLG